jgi:hypothetical protein
VSLEEIRLALLDGGDVVIQYSEAQSVLALKEQMQALEAIYHDMVRDNVLLRLARWHALHEHDTLVHVREGADCDLSRAACRMAHELRQLRL